MNFKMYIFSKIFLHVIVFLYLLSLLGCGNTGTAKPDLSEFTELSIENNPIADYEILFIGNSHSSVNGLPEMVATLVKSGSENTTVNVFNAPGWKFLYERIDDGITQEYLESRPWTHVFLQAQKYSTSGQYFYPTDAAEEWIRRIDNIDAVPILFPEWPRRGNTEEGQRVYELHLSIASRQYACVVPVGPVWDEFIREYPAVNLHAVDGNHSNVKGALLTSFAFYQVITTLPAADLAYVGSIKVDRVVQQQMRLVASSVIYENIGCL